jgi:hypothetical protein
MGSALGAKPQGLKPLYCAAFVSELKLRPPRHHLFGLSHRRLVRRGEIS